MIPPRTTTAGIIATRNQEAFIAESIRSLAPQVDHLIVVDDASVDGTLHEVENSGAANLQIIRNRHRQGVSASFNSAALNTDADILVIQGGDDCSLPGRVGVHLEDLGNPSVALSASIPEIINARGEGLPRWSAPEFIQPVPPGRHLEYLFFRGNFLCAPSVAVRRADYVTSGMFALGLDQLQDYLLWLRIAELGEVRLCDEPMVRYRKHGSNLSRANVEIGATSSRRQRAEFDYVLATFLRQASDRTLERLGRHLYPEDRKFVALSRAEQVTLIALGHPDPIVVRHGLRLLFDVMSEDGGAARLIQMGLTASDVDRYASRADHDNVELADLVLGVLQRSLPPTTERREEQRERAQGCRH